MGFGMRLLGWLGCAALGQALGNTQNTTDGRDGDEDDDWVWGVENSSLLLALLLSAVAVLSELIGAPIIRMFLGTLVAISKYIHERSLDEDDSDDDASDDGKARVPVSMATSTTTATETGVEIPEIISDKEDNADLLRQGGMKVTKMVFVLFRTAVQKRTPRKLARVGFWIFLGAALFVLWKSDGTDESLVDMLAVCVLFTQLMAMYSMMHVHLTSVDAICDVMEKHTAATATVLDDEIIPAVQDVLQLAVTVYWTVMIMSTAGLKVGAAIGGVTVLTLFFTVGSIDYIRNLCGACLLVLDRPFELGNQVSVMGVDGFVENIGLRTTTIKKYDTSRSVIPNSSFLGSVTTNVGRRAGMRFSTTWSICHTNKPTFVQTVETMRNQLTEAISTRETFKDQYVKIRLTIQRGCVTCDLTAVSNTAGNWDAYVEEEAMVASQISNAMAANQLSFHTTG